MHWGGSKTHNIIYNQSWVKDTVRGELDGRDGQRLCYATLLRRSLAWMEGARSWRALPSLRLQRPCTSRKGRRGGLVIWGWIGNYQFRRCSAGMFYRSFRANPVIYTLCSMPHHCHIKNNCLDFFEFRNMNRNLPEIVKKHHQWRIQAWWRIDTIVINVRLTDISEISGLS